MQATYVDQPSSGSSYNWDGDKYHYNWKTSKSQSGFWYYLYVIDNVGNVYYTIIGLK